MPKKKRCPRCGLEKSLREFHKSKNCADGRSTYCKPCGIARQIAYQKKHPDVKKKNDRLYNKRHAPRLRKKAKKYYHTNKVAGKATRRRWYASNRDKNLAYQKRWRRDNAEKKRRSDQAWQRRNINHVLASVVAWKKAHPDRVRESNRRTHLRHPEHKKASSQNRRARERAASGHATGAQVKARIEYYGGLCWLCGKPFQEIDHVIPIAKGGTGWPANLRPLCRPHNRSKGTRHPSQTTRSTILTPCPLPD